MTRLLFTDAGYWAVFNAAVFLCVCFWWVLSPILKSISYQNRLWRDYENCGGCFIGRNPRNVFEHQFCLPHIGIFMIWFRTFCFRCPKLHSPKIASHLSTWFLFPYFIFYNTISLFRAIWESLLLYVLLFRDSGVLINSLWACLFYYHYKCSGLLGATCHKNDETTISRLLL